MIELSYDRAVKRGTEHDDTPEILPAVYGHFSRPFFRRVRFALEVAPGLIGHVVDMSSVKGGGGEPIDGTRDAPVPFNPQAWDDANELYSLLAYWALAYAGELHTQPPVPARKSWAATTGRIVGLPYGVTAADARYAAGITAGWLRVQLERIMHLDPEDVTLFDQNMRDVFRVYARWPQEDRPTYSKLPCPTCGGRLIMFQPSGVGSTRRGRTFPDGRERRFACERCGVSFTDDEYVVEVQAVAVANEERRKLTLKYGYQVPGVWR